MEQGVIPSNFFKVTYITENNTLLMKILVKLNSGM